MLRLYRRQTASSARSAISLIVFFSKVRLVFSSASRPDILAFERVEFHPFGLDSSELLAELNYNTITHGIQLIEKGCIIWRFYPF
ncbi:hypothetical protein [Rhizobium leguminosarum]|uniref:hypothetical protein n=1 Tax=Rhizobium leguminosarum TaxID=384 RepID=UPI001030945E|nr:hypothetical protein [Rhizobium leguminosarum]TAU89510.1 hypothetical protein ELI41_13725 [Rhizobium leguminosarum]TAV54164.1 hypothetical protein ELI29_14430 [Rhizobium leguminosarum]